MSSMLKSALKAVDWNSNVSELCSSDDFAQRVEAANLRLAVWSKQFEQLDVGNPSIAFVREMQRGGHDVACCLALALYKPAAASMRSILECALYYAYFRTHLSELVTLVRDEKYYASKKEILQFFARHVPDYAGRQATLNYAARIEAWYSSTSAIVHGQIPGKWTFGSSVAEIKHHPAVLTEAISHFEESVALVQDTFLCVLAPEMWAFFETEAKKAIVKGMAGTQKTALGLDVA